MPELLLHWFVTIFLCLFGVHTFISSLLSSIKETRESNLVKKKANHAGIFTGLVAIVVGISYGLHFLSY